MKTGKTLTLCILFFFLKATAQADHHLFFVYILIEHKKMAGVSNCAQGVKTQLAPCAPIGVPIIHYQVKPLTLCMLFFIKAAAQADRHCFLV